MTFCLHICKFPLVIDDPAKKKFGPAWISMLFILVSLELPKLVKNRVKEIVHPKMEMLCLSAYSN